MHTDVYVCMYLSVSVNKLLSFWLPYGPFSLSMCLGAGPAPSVIFDYSI